MVVTDLFRYDHIDWVLRLKLIELNLYGGIRGKLRFVFLKSSRFHRISTLAHSCPVKMNNQSIIGSLLTSNLENRSSNKHFELKNGYYGEGEVQQFHNLLN